MSKGVTSSIQFATNEEIKRRAEETGGEYYTYTHDEVVNPLSIDKVEQLVKEVFKEFRVLARNNPDTDIESLRSKYKHQHRNNKDKTRFLTETHSIIAKTLMQRELPVKMYDALLYMIRTKKIENSLNYTEEEKDKAVGKMQNDLFDSCLIEESE